MTIKIGNIGKILDAELELRGITVVVGDNNTGKSTIGKCLYAFFNALQGINEEVERQRRRQIYREIKSISDSYTMHGFSIRAFDRLIDNFYSTGNADAMKKWLKDHFMIRADEKTIDLAIYNIIGIRNMPDGDIKNQIIYNYFDSLFAGQFLSVKNGVESGVVIGTLKGIPVEINLTRDEVRYQSNLNIQHQAFFVDNSEVLNYWGRYRYTGGMNGLSNSIRRNIDSALRNSEETSPSDSALEDLLYGGAYNRMQTYLKRIIEGQFVFDKDEIIKFEDETHNKAQFDLCNVSEGVKGFGVLGILLSQHAITFEDILILDEPEVHLHPLWLLKYAEFIVLLQKEFSLTVLLTTHSSMFLFALQLYARKYKMADKLNAYEICSDTSNHDYSAVKRHGDISNDIDSAILSFSSASEELGLLINEVNAMEDTNKDNVMEK